MTFENYIHSLYPAGLAPGAVKEEAKIEITVKDGRPIIDGTYEVHGNVIHLCGDDDGVVEAGEAMEETEGGAVETPPSTPSWPSFGKKTKK